ncbi:Zinc finger C3H1 domain-containing protein, partial [Quaeritorhiza haematococci]
GEYRDVREQRKAGENSWQQGNGISRVPSRAGLSGRMVSSPGPVSFPSPTRTASNESTGTAGRDFASNGLPQKRRPRKQKVALGDFEKSGLLPANDRIVPPMEFADFHLDRSASPLVVASPPTVDISVDEEDMDLDHHDVGTIILPGTWRTVEPPSVTSKIVDGKGPRLSQSIAADAPARSTPDFRLSFPLKRGSLPSKSAAVFPARTREKFVEERPISYVIDLSDSSDDEGGASRTPSSSMSNGAGDPTRGVTDQVKAKLLQKELEIKKVLQMIAMKQKAKKSKASTIVSKANTNGSVSVASSNDSQDSNNEDTPQVTGESRTSEPGSSMADPKGTTAADASNLTNLKLHSTMPAQGIQSAAKAQLPKKPVSPASPPLSRRASASAALSIKSSITAPVRNTASADAATGLRKRLENEIQTAEQSLTSLQTEIKENEAELETLRKKMVENERAVTERQAKIEILRQELLKEEAELDAERKTGEELSTLNSNVKKTLLDKTKGVTELQGAINSKRLQLLELVNQMKSSGGKRPFSETDPLRTSREKSPKKRAKGPSATNGKEQQHPAAATTPGAGDYIELPGLDELLSTAKRESAERQQLRENPGLGKETLLREKLASLPWEKPSTVVPLFILNDFLQCEEDLCTRSDLVEAGIDVQGSLDSGAPRSRTTKAARLGADIAQPAPEFAPYESILSRFRSYRMGPTYRSSSKSVKSSTFSNKIDPHRKVCLFESLGGSCNDETCTSQHFRDVTMSDQEVLEEMLTYADTARKSEQEIEALKKRLELLRSAGKSIDEQVEAVYLHHRLNNPGGSVHYIAFTQPKRHAPARKPDEVTKTGTADTHNDPKTADLHPATIEGQKIQLHRIPVLLDGLQKLLDGEQIKSGRYYQATISEEEYERLVRKDPKNVQLWINYAAELLPSMNFESLEKVSGNMNKTLNVLSRALQHNRDSEVVWNFYLEIYSRRGSDSDVRQVFEQAIGFLPLGLSLWWRYVMWEKVVDKKQLLLQRMLNILCSESALSFLDRSSRSRGVLEVLFHLVKLRLQAAGVASAIEQFRSLLLETELNELMRVRGAPETALENLMKARQVHPDNDELLDLTARVYEHANDYEAAVMCILDYLRYHPLRFPLWNRCAKLALEGPFQDALILSLINCIRVAYEGLDEIQELPSSADELAAFIDEAKSLYQKALALTTSESIAVDNSLTFRTDVSRGRLRSDLHLWLNYVLLSSVGNSSSSFLSSSLSDLRHTFEVALETVKDVKPRNILWKE